MKNKKFQRITSIVLVLAMVLSFGCVYSSAAEVDEIIPPDDMAPRYEITCSSGGQHAMHPCGGGRVYTGTAGNQGSYVGFYDLYQCSYCNIVLASELNPIENGTLGHYVLFDWPDPIPMWGTTVYLNGESLSYFDGNLVRDSFWGGFAFMTS